MRNCRLSNFSPVQHWVLESLPAAPTVLRIDAILALVYDLSVEPLALESIRGQNLSALVITAANLTMVCSHIKAAQMDPISKSDFKAHALEVLREVEETGKPRIITNCGRPTLEIWKLRQNQASPLEVLKGSVLKYKGATLPVDDDDWDLA